jgi:hypothetical protein
LAVAGAIKKPKNKSKQELNRPVATRYRDIGKIGHNLNIWHKLTN